MKMLRSIQEDAYAQESDDVIGHHSLVLCTGGRAPQGPDPRGTQQAVWKPGRCECPTRGFRSEGMAWGYPQ